MIDPTVRRALTTDIEVLDLLQREARDAVVEQRGGGRWLAEHPVITDWDELIEAGRARVGHIDEVVVGYITSELGADLIVRVDQVWVTPEARELGFGDALLALVIDDARHDGGIAVEGQSLPGDRQTKNLYERAGIVARLITTYRAFEVSDPANSADASR